MSRPFKVLIYLHSFDAGGVERVALRLARGWRALGAEVSIAMGRRGGPLQSEAPADVPVIYPRRTFSWTRHFESLWLVPHLIATVRRTRPDVLFCAGNTYVVVAVLARMVLGAGCPPIVCKVSNSLDRRDFGPVVHGLYAAWLRFQTRFIEHFVGLSPSTFGEMRWFLGVSASRLSVICDPALSINQIGLERRPDPAQGGRRFVAAGRLATQKAFDHLIRAFAQLPAGRDHLTIFGDGPERMKLLRLVEQLGLADRVHMPGHVADIGPSLVGADALVLSSRYEGAPAVVLEAFAKGVPVIATDCSASLRELLGDGWLGRLVPVGDVEALARVMGSFEPRAYDCESLVAKARQYTVEEAAPRYLDLMQAVAAASAHRPEAVADPQAQRDLMAGADGADDRTSQRF